MNTSAAGDLLLEAHALSRQFGGLRAVDAVSIQLVRGRLSAVIGTNGAGKSTLINMLSGELAATAGRVEIKGQEATTWSQPKRARAGIGRSYQRTTIFPTFTVLENCRLCAQARWPRVLRIGTAADTCAKSVSAARQALERTGLAEEAHRIAGTLSHGQKRQLELALCLSTGPDILLLDEPLAGMGAEESERMLTLLQQLKSEHAILLVEHDMDAVFRVADQITVMVNGAVIASDGPAAIRMNADVQRAYLGETA